MVFVLIIGIFTPCVSASDYLNIDTFVANKKDDGYPSNNGKWDFDYIGTVQSYGVIKNSEKLKYSNFKTKASVYDVVELLTRLKYVDETGKSIGYMKEDGAYDNIVKGMTDLPNYLQNLQLTKAAFCRYLNIYLLKSNNVYLNSVELKDISDVTDRTTCNKEIVEVLRYGILDLDSKGKFYPYAKLTYSDLMKAISRLINPYYRVTTNLYKGDKIEIQSNTYPMYYKNHD